VTAIYTKIPALFKRDSENPQVVTDVYKDRYVEALADVSIWSATEKLDGANTRIHWDGYVVRVGSRRTWQHQPNIVDAIELAYPHLEAMFEQDFDRGGLAPIDDDVTVYGEAIGAGVQNGGSYGDKIRFVAFDVTVGGKYLENRDARDVVWQLGLDFVERRGGLGLVSATEIYQWMSEGHTHWPHSTYREGDPEGFVLKTVPPLYKPNGDRIMVKLTYRDLEQADT